MWRSWSARRVCSAVGRRRSCRCGPPEAAGLTAVGVDRSEEGLKELPDGIAREAALVHLTSVLDLELRPLGIGVNAVAPQPLDTAHNRQYLTPGLLARAVAPDAVAGIIVYLVSDAAAPASGAVVPA